jgi:hypothetical protein
MKKIHLLLIALFAALVCQAQPPSSATLSSPPDTSNYNIHVAWLDDQGQSNSLDVLTAEGQFSLDTIQKNRVKIDDYEVPQTTKFTGDLKVFNPEKGRLKIFLGRTIPYVTSKFANGGRASSSHSQLSVGLDSAFNVTFGKPLVIQTDANGPITVLVSRVEN